MHICPTSRIVHPFSVLLRGLPSGNNESALEKLLQAAKRKVASPQVQAGWGLLDWCSLQTSSQPVSRCQESVVLTVKQQ